MSNLSFIQSRPCITAHFRNYITSLIALELNCLASEVTIKTISIYFSLNLVHVYYSFNGKNSIFEYRFNPLTCVPLDKS